MGRILFVNDDPDYTAAWTALLEEAGHRVEPKIHTGRELLELLDRERIDVVVLDKEVGGPLSTDEVLAILRSGQRTAQVPILFLGDPSTPIEAEEPDHVLRKPVAPPQLIACVDAMIRAKHANR